MINVGTQKDTSKSAAELAEGREGVFATVGLHPIHTDKSYHDEKELGESGFTQHHFFSSRKSGAGFTSRGEDFDCDYYKKLAQNGKVVAIGECGLDYYRVKNKELGIKKQIDAFEQHISLALELDLPLMVHCRPTPGSMDAYKDTFEILNSYFLIHNSKLRGNVHFFAGSCQEAKKFLDIGFTISFTGVITFANSYDEVIENTPLDMILSETDCPYVAPAPYRGKRNEPIYVREVVRQIAEIKKLPFGEVQKRLVQNALRVFGTPLL
jgi:TatD DNase family protein